MAAAAWPVLSGSGSVAGSRRPSWECCLFVETRSELPGRPTLAFAQRTTGTDLPSERVAACVYLCSSATNNRVGLRVCFPARGETRVSADLGQETSRRAKAGPAIRRAARGGSYTTPRKSGCFGPTVTDRRVDEAAGLAAGELQGPGGCGRETSRGMKAGPPDRACGGGWRVPPFSGNQGLRAARLRRRMVDGAPSLAAGDEQVRRGAWVETRIPSPAGMGPERFRDS